MTPIMTKSQAAELITAARIRKKLSWADIAEKLDAPLVWCVAALLGQHPMTQAQAEVVCELLDLDVAVAESLQLQPSRGIEPAKLDPWPPNLAKARFLERFDAFASAG